MSSQVIENTAIDNINAAGLKAVLNIFKKWECSNEQIQKILSVSRAALHNYKHNPEKAKLTADQLERISYILNIHATLRTVFSNPENQYGFMKMPNNNPYFNGKTPLALIATGKFGILYEVFKRIDTMRGGAW
ncbi:MbcA/ParS/Xre antitoxin family protein [Thalassotalea piscium]|uniref:Uncharacterized protein (DUF2384 family) n=1 Tax=Thalassotalea piscium TaxID=1230533 RepID=A0A7X0NEH5_9GAMM|nr:MbcA/ParS/Xre antitoxin family protein [Thalassotalea piscium]MBB6541947.1 uncharacterized protein (DUF2384 family) [Thalassotalea piscium]